MKQNLPHFYLICSQPDNELFKKQCAALEKKFPDMQKLPLLEDVDGSAYQTYRHEKGTIRVGDDRCLWCLYIEADFDLLPYFD